MVLPLVRYRAIVGKEKWRPADVILDGGALGWFDCHMRLTFCALLGVVALFGIVSCASRQVLQPSKNEVVKPGVISVAGNWIKRKGNKVDASIVVKNVSGEFLSIPNSDLQCLMAENAVKAEFRVDGNIEQFKNSLRDDVALSPDEERRLEIVCKFGQSKGAFGIRVRNVYKRVSTSGDSVKVEKVADNVTWWAAGEP